MYKYLCEGGGGGVTQIFFVFQDLKICTSFFDVQYKFFVLFLCFVPGLCTFRFHPLSSHNTSCLHLSAGIGSICPYSRICLILCSHQRGLPPSSIGFGENFIDNFAIIADFCLYCRDSAANEFYLGDSKHFRSCNSCHNWCYFVDLVKKSCGGR